MPAPKGNQFAKGLTNSGRPPFFKTSEQLEVMVDRYFVHILGEFHEEDVEQWNPMTNQFEQKTVKVWTRPPEPATITGLALYLGFCDKVSLYDYRVKDEFAYSIKRAISKIENAYEQNLSSKDKSPAGAIFALKNFGWTDKTQIEVGPTPEDTPQRINFIKTYDVDHEEVKPVELPEKVEAPVSKEEPPSQSWTM